MFTNHGWTLDTSTIRLIKTATNQLDRYLYYKRLKPFTRCHVQPAVHRFLRIFFVFLLFLFNLSQIKACKPLADKYLQPVKVTNLQLSIVEVFRNVFLGPNLWFCHFRNILEETLHFLVPSQLHLRVALLIQLYFTFSFCIYKVVWFLSLFLWKWVASVTQFIINKCITSLPRRMHLSRELHRLV